MAKKKKNLREHVHLAARGSSKGQGGDCKCSAKWTSMQFCSSGGKRDFKRLLKSALICPIHFQESIFTAQSLRQDLPMYTTGGRVNERKKQRKTHTHTHTRINVRQLAMACHTLLRMQRSQSSDSIHQARQREKECCRGKEGRSKQGLGGERYLCKTTPQRLSAQERQQVKPGKHKTDGKRGSTDGRKGKERKVQTLLRRFPLTWKSLPLLRLSMAH